MLYALARGATPVQTRDTLTVTFIGFAVLGGAALVIGGAEAPHAGALAALIPCAVVGHLLGRPVFARIAEDRYEPVLTAVLIASARRARDRAPLAWTPWTSKSGPTSPAPGATWASAGSRPRSRIRAP